MIQISASPTQWNGFNYASLPWDLPLRIDSPGHHHECWQQMTISWRGESYCEGDSMATTTDTQLQEKIKVYSSEISWSPVACSSRIDYCFVLTKTPKNLLGCLAFHETGASRDVYTHWDLIGPEDDSGMAWVARIWNFSPQWIRSLTQAPSRTVVEEV